MKFGALGLNCYSETQRSLTSIEYGEFVKAFFPQPLMLGQLILWLHPVLTFNLLDSAFATVKDGDE